MKSIIVVLLMWISLFLISCGGNGYGSMEVFDIDPSKEIAEDVVMIYSDSAIIKYKVESPLQVTYIENHKLVEEYPRGLQIEFYDKSKKIISSMQSNYARRVSADGLMMLRDSVVLVNDLGDKLTTRRIEWDELKHTLTTAKFVQLIKVSTHDTVYGFGFHALDDFSKFRITQLTGKRKYQNLVE